MSGLERTTPWAGRRVIEASAPVRICDNGGWTDTCFGAPGRVVNVAVVPGVRVDISHGRGRDRVVLDVESFGDRYPVVPGAARTARHGLLEAAIDLVPPPRDLEVEITVRSAVPPGCGTGTSAAVTVALLGALSALRGEELSARDAAYAAHRLEVDALGGESGIQDQLSAAFGGINYIEIESYPEATVTALPAWKELDARLMLVFLGRAHNSSSVHQQVIETLGAQGSGAWSRLRHAADDARDAVVARNLEAFGRAMIANTDAQMALHSELVGADARRLIDVVAAHGVIGWKVNGAGGEGGSVTLLAATADDKPLIQRRVEAVSPSCKVLPVSISDVGLEVRTAL